MRHRLPWLRFLVAIPMLFAALAVGAQPAAAAPPAGFHESVVASGLGVPTGLAWTPDGRMLVTSKAGTLTAFSGGARTTALDVRASTCTQGEQGLESVTADPGFA